MSYEKVHPEDGTELGRGLVVSRYGLWRRAVYRCRCGNEQVAQYLGFDGGISEELAVEIGWRRSGGSWICPICSHEDEAARLKEVGK